jgi:Flp pilus assembly protein TadB
MSKRKQPSYHKCVIELLRPGFFESPPAGDEFTSKHKEQSKSGTQRFERTMKPLFVSIKEDQRVVHWKKLTAFSIAVLVVTALLVEGLWWLVSNTLSPGALIVALVLGTLIVVRVVVRAITYQEQELEVTAEST